MRLTISYFVSIQWVALFKTIAAIASSEAACPANIFLLRRHQEEASARPSTIFMFAD